MLNLSANFIKYFKKILFPFYKNKELKFVFKKLHQDYPEEKIVARFVGGCVRKYLTGDKIDDIDIATILTSDEIKLKFKNTMVWHKDTNLPKSDLIVIPGGFSYGDYLRSGAIAGKSNILNEVIKAANDGCLVLGICNGFQILTETGLLKGALLRNKNLKFLGKDIYVKAINTENKFCNKYEKNEIYNCLCSTKS